MQVLIPFFRPSPSSTKYTGRILRKKQILKTKRKECEKESRNSLMKSWKPFPNNFNIGSNKVKKIKASDTTYSSLSKTHLFHIFIPFCLTLELFSPAFVEITCICTLLSEYMKSFAHWPVKANDQGPLFDCLPELL